MPQYIPYNPIYIPEVQPYKPDFNFLANVAQTRQSRYDASYKKISEMYGTLLNAPMTRDENIKKRDEFFKMIDQDIKKMSGMDLSLQQNQDAAMQVFKGLYEDQDIVKDMAWTKNLYGAMQRGEALKYCADPAKCDGEWWQGGDEYLQLKQQEFKKASREEALSFKNPEYIAHYNVEAMAIKAAKDAGFNMKIDTEKGGYIVTDENGNMMAPTLADFYLHKYGSDPKVMKMYGAQAELNRNKWVQSNLNQFGGDEAKANYAYITQMLDISKNAKDKQAKYDAEVANVKSNKKLAEEELKTRGYDEKLQEVYKSLLTEESVMESVAQNNKTQADLGEKAGLNLDNLKYAIKNIDEVVALNLLKQSTNTAAMHYSTLTQKREMKADPYKLATHTSNLALRNGLKMIDANLSADLIKKRAQHEYNMIEKYGTAGLGPETDAEGNKLESRPDARGAATKAGAINPKDENYTYRHKLIEENINSKSNFLTSFITEAANKYNKTDGNKQKEWLKGSLAKVLANTGIAIDDVLKRNLTSQDMQKLSSLGEDKVTAAYTLASDYADPKKGGILAASFFSNDFNRAHAAEMYAIKAKEAQFKDMENHLENIAQNAANKTQGDFLALNTFEGKGKASIVKMFTDIYHRPFSEEEAKTFNETTTGKKMAAKYADEHWREFLTKRNSFINPNSKNIDPSDMMAAKGDAILFYNENVVDALSAYDKDYNSTAPSYRQVGALGGKYGNALTSLAFGGTYDKDMPGEQTAIAADWMKTYRSNAQNPNVKIAFGDAAEIPAETDAQAKLATDFLLSKMSDRYKPGDASRPKFTWHAQNIAGGDPNYVSMTFNLDPAFVKEHTGTEKNPGVLAGLEGQTEVTMFFPKNIVHNKYTAKFETNPYQYQFESGGIHLDMYPDVKVDFLKIDGGMQKVLKYKDEQGNEKTQSWVLSSNVDFEQTVNQTIAQLDKAQAAIDSKKAANYNAK